VKKKQEAEIDQGWSIVKVAGGDGAQVAAAVRQAIHMAGGMVDLIRPGMRVMINPTWWPRPPRRRQGPAPPPWSARRWRCCEGTGGPPDHCRVVARGADTEAAYRIMAMTRCGCRATKCVDLKQDKTVRMPLVGGTRLSDITTFELGHPGWTRSSVCRS